MPPFGTEIIITHISTLAGNDNQLMDWFKDIAETNIQYPYTRFKFFSGDKELNYAIKYLEADIMCMATARRGYFEKIFKGSLTKKWLTIATFLY